MDRVWIPALIVAVLVILAVGVSLPMVTTDRLIGETSTYSVITGIADLFATGETGLAILILCFSIVFPVGKMLALGAVWFFRPGRQVEERTLATLKVLGKWSMLDFFVVAMLASALELGVIASTSARAGVHVFGGAILLSMVVTYLVSIRFRTGEHGRGEPAPGRVPAALAVLVLVNGVLFWRAVEAPLMKVEKWWFWEKEYSILAGALELWRGESPLIGGVLLLFVVIVPAVVLAGWVVLCVASWIVRPLPRPVARGFLMLEEWAMTDVFALAVFVVAAKIAGVVSFEAREGLWLLGATGILFVVLSAWGRQALRRET